MSTPIDADHEHRQQNNFVYRPGKHFAVDADANVDIQNYKISPELHSSEVRH